MDGGETWIGFDYVRLSSNLPPPIDGTPPNPNPMTWQTPPYATGSTSIAMQATPASDPSGVQYYFTALTTGGHDSGWRDNPFYEDTGLSPSVRYTYSVRARDKSANLNETASSVEAAATTEPPPPRPPYFDGFETGSLTAGGWTVAGSGSVTVKAQAAYAGSYGAEIRGVVTLETEIDTSGFTGIKVKWIANSAGLDNNEWLFVEWYDGSAWQPLGQVRPGSWTPFEATCGAAAANNPAFRIRFRLNSNHAAGEWVRVDDVQVIGTPQ